MRTYDDLTKVEKEKLTLYKLYNQPIVFVITGLLIMSMMLACTGIILTFIFPIWFCVCILFLSMYLLLCSTFLLRKVQKENFLIFGWKNTIEDVFEITTTDVKNITIERKEIWRKK